LAREQTERETSRKEEERRREIGKEAQEQVREASRHLARIAPCRPSIDGHIVRWFWVWDVSCALELFRALLREHPDG